jgi:hypothetical protein
VLRSRRPSSNGLLPILRDMPLCPCCTAATSAGMSRLALLWNVAARVCLRRVFQCRAWSLPETKPGTARFIYSGFIRFTIKPGYQEPVQIRFYSVLSSVDGTFVRMKTFHITFTEGNGDPVRRRVCGHPPRRGIILARFSGCAAWEAHLRRGPQTTKNKQIRPTTRPWFILLSGPLSSFPPPSVRHLPSATCLSLVGTQFRRVNLIGVQVLLYISNTLPYSGDRHKHQRSDPHRERNSSHAAFDMW